MTHKSLFFTAQDGARLHVAQWGEKSDKLPIVCLAGLTRNFNDFAKLAPQLNRRVYAFDYRGRGLSDFKPPYLFLQEQADILLVLNELNIKEAIFIGTSRGGMHTMHLAPHFPNLIKASILNDIGAEIELDGLLKIKEALAKRGETPKNYEQAATQLKKLLSDEFSHLNNDDWLFLATSIWFESNGKLELSYDATLAQGLDGMNKDTKLPTAWNEFEALAKNPCLIMRGEHSTLLSKATFNRMKNFNSHTKGVEITGQGHAPIMSGVVNDAIIEFLKEII